MRHGFLVAITALMAGAGLAWGQEPPMGPEGGVVGYPTPSNPEGLATNNSARPNFWFGAEYLGWYSKRSTLIYPVLTSGTASQQGIYGANTTYTLYQGTDGQDFASGGRVTAGMFFAGDNRFGMEFGGYALGNLQSRYEITTSGTGSPLIARPYIDSTTLNNASLVTAATNVGSGYATVDADTQAWGANASWLLNLYRTSPQSPWGFDFNVYAGLSFMSVRDSFDIATSTDYFDNVPVTFEGQNFTARKVITQSPINLVSTGVFFVPINFVLVQFTRQFFSQVTDDRETKVSTGTVDRFTASNQFYGGHAGFSAKIRNGRWSLGLNGKLGVGVVRSNIEVEGYSTLKVTTSQTVTEDRTGFDAISGLFLVSRDVRNTQNITEQTAVGGVYAVNGVVGRRTNTKFAYMPEGVLNLNYQFTPTLSGSVGYNFVYLSKVVRSTDLINQVVDPSLIPLSPSYATGNRGAPQVNLTPYSSYFMHGISAGLSISY